MLEPGSVTAVESIPRGRAPESGAAIRQLTSTPAIHEDIYGEVPYMDPTGRWLMLTRKTTSHGPQEIWRCDLERGWLTPVCDNVPSIVGMAVSPDQRFFYCIRDLAEGEFELLVTDIASLEQHRHTYQGPPQPVAMGSVSPDLRTYITATEFSPTDHAICRYDLETGTRRVIHEWADIINAHPQLEPGHGQDVMVQHNRGAQFDEQGRCLALVGPEGATLYLIDIDGGNRRELPVGLPYTARCQGHQCWVGMTGDILLTVEGTAEALAEGNLLVLTPGDDAARPVAAGHYYGHPNASRDGRFFVSDTFGDALIVVGSLKTGRTKVLCASGSSFGAPQYTHPHPYFSPGNQWVIYNSDATGVPHVYAARVPEGLLEALEE